MSDRCLTCRSSFEQPWTGRRRTYCSPACKQADYRERRRAQMERERAQMIELLRSLSAVARLRDEHTT